MSNVAVKLRQSKDLHHAAWLATPHLLNPASGLAAEVAQRKYRLMRSCAEVVPVLVDMQHIARTRPSPAVYDNTFAVAEAFMSE